MKSLLFTFVFLIGLTGVSAAQTPTYDGVSFSISLTDGLQVGESRTSFGQGEEIFIKTKLQNNSDAPFPYGADGTEYNQFKFTLYKMGRTEPVEYRDDRAKTLKHFENGSDGIGIFMQVDPIPSGEASELATMKLGDRYENLSPGDYTLSVEFRTLKFLKIDGRLKRLLLTDSVNFTITAKTKNTPTCKTAESAWYLSI